MKRFIDGQEVELDPRGATVSRLQDRLIVKTPEGAFSAVAIQQGGSLLVSYKGRQYKIDRTMPRKRSGGAAATGELRAPMPGQIVDVLLAPGASVQKGQKILVLEAMKTQQAFVAPFDGTLKTVAVEKGRQVAEGELMALVEAADTEFNRVSE